MKLSSDKLYMYALGILLFTGNNLVLATDTFSALGVDIPKTRLLAPAFSLANLNGNETHLSDFKDKVILLNFWATWCTPCRKEMPDMQKLWKTFENDDFVILAVAADQGKKKQIESFVNKLGLTFPILLDPKGKVRNNYEVMGLPMSYLIGKDGKISGRIVGIRDWGGSEANAVIRRLLSLSQ